MFEEGFALNSKDKKVFEVDRISNWSNSNNA